MNTQTTNRTIATSMATLLLTAVSPTVSFAGETCPSNGSGPDICVALDGVTPVQGTHFTVDYSTDPSNPSVALKTGSLTWNVRSDDSGSAGNIGTISLDPTVSTANFQVSILDETDPGANIVGQIDLTAASWTGHSSLIDVEIALGISDGFEVVEDGSGNGGIVENVVIRGPGGVDGDIIIPNLKSLTLEGDGFGDIFIEEILVNGILDIQNRVLYLRAIQIDMMRSGSTVKIAETFPTNTAIAVDDMETGVTIEIGYAVGLWAMDGGVTLGTGLSSGSSLIIHEQQEENSVINLTGDALAGTIEFKRRTHGTVLAGSVSSTGLIELNNMNGPITISGDMAGEIHDISSVQDFLQIDGDLSGDIIIDRDLMTPLNIDGANGVTSTGSITVVRDVTSGDSINIAGDMAGAIDIQMNLIGDLNIDGDMGSTGSISIAGDVTGDVDVAGDSDRIDIAGGLVDVGRVLVGGEAKDGITLGAAVCPSALVRVLGGLDGTGYIDIDPDTTVCNAVGPQVHGDIEIGNGGNIIFDPSAYILISDGGSPPGGDWTGDITVSGDFVEDPGDELEICVCGTLEGTLSITQPSANPTYDTPTAACNSHCN